MRPSLYLSVLSLSIFSLFVDFHSICLVGAAEKTHPAILPHQKKVKSPPSSVIQNAKSVKITKIDDEPIASGQPPQVGRQVSVEGTIPDPKMIACVAVHPINGDTWWIQNLPGPPDQISTRAWRIRTVALCGTETLGRREDYEIVILTESKRSICTLGKQFKTANFPTDIARSEVVRVRRTKD